MKMLRSWLLPVLVLPTVVVSSLPHAQQGLVGAYGFDDGTGALAADASGNGNNGTLSGATWTLQGKYGGALSFDGTNNLVLVNDATSLRLTRNMTIEAWVNPRVPLTGRKALVQKDPSTYFLLASLGAFGLPTVGGTYFCQTVTSA